MVMKGVLPPSLPLSLSPSLPTVCNKMRIGLVSVSCIHFFFLFWGFSSLPLLPLPSERVEVPLCLSVLGKGWTRRRLGVLWDALRGVKASVKGLSRHSRVSCNDSLSPTFGTIAWFGPKMPSSFLSTSALFVYLPSSHVLL